ncbi:MAG: ABC transporter permease [bacterium]|nr:ABC transporter permease [bacterium]
MSALSAPWYDKPIAFLRKDFTVEKSYRLAFLSRISSIFLSVILFYYIARLLGKDATPYLAAYGGEYFPFVLVGIAFYRYFNAALAAYPGNVREGQVTGTLEAMLVTPTSPRAILIYSSLGNFVYATLEVGLYLLLGVLFFGLDVGEANLWSVLVVLSLTVLSFSPFGILSAAFILAFKRGDPIAYIFGALSALLGGVYFPVALLPDALQIFSRLIPLTYGLRAMRHAVLSGSSISQLGVDLAVLAVLPIIMIPLSLLVFDRALIRAKKEGTLLQH